MRKLILNCGYALGDVVMFTAAVRDLHLYYPDEFETDVRTHHPHLWHHNPYLTRLPNDTPGVEVIDCQVPLVAHANYAPYHCIHAFVDFLNKELGTAVKVSRIGGDIHLGDYERELPSKIDELAGADIPYWIVSGGGKFDLTIKWWSSERYQQVIEHFRGRVQFVQVGDDRHWHPPLQGAIDLRGQTSVRGLVRLMHHAQGVLCGVTGIMHLAAAVPTRAGRPPHRPCVVVGGGREPSHWEAYGPHQCIHTIGALPCCERGGCWRSRTAPIGDGTERDQAGKLCVDTVGPLPRCMDMITVDEVVDRIERYFSNRGNSYLAEEEQDAAARAISLTESNPFDSLPLTVPKAHFTLARTVANTPHFPSTTERRGIVICASDRRYSANAWVCIHRLRELGCALPVELWTLVQREETDRLRESARPLGVRVIDAEEAAEGLALRRLDGWTLRMFALTRSSFLEVLLLDADNCPIEDPTSLFTDPGFTETGALFWPDTSPIVIGDPALRPLGIEAREEPRFETGQILVDRERHWTALHLAHWFAENDDFFYDHLSGDHAFQVAFWKADNAYAIAKVAPKETEDGLIHFAPNGGPLFEHRRNRKLEIPDNGKLNGDSSHDSVAASLREFAAEVWPDSPPPKLRHPREEQRFWHVYFDPQFRGIDDRKTHNFSRSIWEHQYAEAPWQPLGLRPTQLPRITRTARDNVAPYLDDLIAHALRHVNDNDWIVLSGIGICPAPGLTAHLRGRLNGTGAAYAYTRHFPALAQALTDEQVSLGEQGNTCGLFAFRASSWTGLRSLTTDVALDRAAWGNPLRDAIKATCSPSDTCLDDAIYDQGNQEPSTKDR